jgi:hypothetical protein
MVTEVGKTEVGTLRPLDEVLVRLDRLPGRCAGATAPCLHDLLDAAHNETSIRADTVDSHEVTGVRGLNHRAATDVHRLMV